MRSQRNYADDQEQNLLAYEGGVAVEVGEGDATGVETLALAFQIFDGLVPHSAEHVVIGGLVRTYCKGCVREKG